jgi:hypothetical protein
LPTERSYSSASRDDKKPSAFSYGKFQLSVWKVEFTAEAQRTRR